MNENCFKQKLRPGRRRRIMPVANHVLVFASFVSLLWMSEGATSNQPVAFVMKVVLPSRTIESSLNNKVARSLKLKFPNFLSSQNDNLDHTINESNDISALKSIEAQNKNIAVPESGRQKIRRKVRDLAKSVSFTSSLQKTKAASAAAMFMPQAVAAIIRDATKSAVEMALDEIMPRLSLQSTSSDTDSSSSRASSTDLRLNNILDAKRIDSLLDEAFLPMEKSLEEMEISLQKARSSLEAAKQEAKVAMQQIQTAVLDQATASTVAVVVDQQQKQLESNKIIDTKTASYDDIDYANCEMAPPFLDEDQCLVQGEPVVRVEKAPENSRRIFAGIDILASVDTVWSVLTDYGNLQNVVPNLVVNEVLELYNYNNTDNNTTQQLSDAALSRLSEEEQCRVMCERMKGSKLRQVGGAKVAGIQFSARTTLEVREWPNGMPDYAHFEDDVYEGKNRMNRAKEYTKIPLERYRFPRPFAISKLPTKDISMQSILNDDGEFRMYQGVWRMQPLVGCAPQGQEAMRLTYAVQISPRPYLPVGLIEGRIVRDLCTNLLAIRDYVASIENSKTSSISSKSTTSQQKSLASK